MLVEDNAGDARLLQETLADAKPSQFEIVHCAGRLSDAVSFLEQNAADLILLDLTLPDSMGFDTFDKTHAHAPHTPMLQPILVPVSPMSSRSRSTSSTSGPTDRSTAVPLSWNDI